jgi:hypothetical protein
MAIGQPLSGTPAPDFDPLKSFFKAALHLRDDGIEAPDVYCHITENAMRVTSHGVTYDIVANLRLAEQSGATRRND